MEGETLAASLVDILTGAYIIDGGGLGAVTDAYVTYAAGRRSNTSSNRHLFCRRSEILLIDENKISSFFAVHVTSA